MSRPGKRARLLACALLCRRFLRQRGCFKLLRNEQYGVKDPSGICCQKAGQLVKKEYILFGSANELN